MIKGKIKLAHRWSSYWLECTYQYKLHTPKYNDAITCKMRTCSSGKCHTQICHQTVRTQLATKIVIVFFIIKVGTYNTKQNKARRCQFTPFR